MREREREGKREGERKGGERVRRVRVRRERQRGRGGEREREILKRETMDPSSQFSRVGRGPCLICIDVTAS